MIYLLAIISIVSAVSPFGQISGSYTEVSRSKKGNVETVQWQYTKPGEYYEKPTSPAHSEIKLEVTQDSTYEITFKIINSQDTFEIPHEFPFPYNKESTSTPKYNYFLNSQGSVFRLERLDGTVLFDLKSTDVLSLLYHELHVSKESSYIWGLGERRIDTYKLQNGEYTIWTFDNGALETKTKGGQMYGHHPVYLQNIKSKYHITFLRSSRPMTVQLTDNELIYRITGGQIEFKFFIGNDDARDVIKQYHRYINGWALHPFWSSGWHQSRWGYKNISVLRGVVEGYKTNNIPLDTLWTDLDYMQDRKDFTLDQVNFPKLEMQKLIDLTKPDGVNWVPIIDPGVAVKSQCGDRLVQSGAYIRSNKQNKTPLKGSVWPGDVYFPDFNHQGAFQLWHQCQLDFQTEYGIIPRGIWIDMNELANFVDGEISDTKTKLNPNIFELNDLPFDAAGKGTLEGHTISIDGLHAGGRFFKGNDIPELDLHSFNGFMESIITQESQAVIQKSNLTFILTRASIFGSGRFVQHWFGDNGATWTWLKNSIAAMFNFNLFGIPFSGDDICGFNGDSNAQLCARWIQLGVFYPFSRNHNSIDNKDQEPYVFTKYVIEAAQKSISLRYSLLKYHYALFVSKRDSSIDAGVGTIVDPIFYRSKDPIALDVDTQFYFGEIVVIPTVEQQQQDVEYTDITYYVPYDATWYSFETGKQLQKGWNLHRSNFNSAPFIALNAGSIIVWSDATGVQRTRFLPQEINLIVTLDQNLSATGQFLSIKEYDDKTIESKCWNIIYEYSCLKTVSVVLKKDVLVFTNTAPANDQSEAIIIQNIILYYKETIETFTVKVSSLTKQWQINL